MGYQSVIGSDIEGTISSVPLMQSWFPKTGLSALWRRTWKNSHSKCRALTHSANFPIYGLGQTLVRFEKIKLWLSPKKKSWATQF